MIGTRKLRIPSASTDLPASLDVPGRIDGNERIAPVHQAEAPGVDGVHGDKDAAGLKNATHFGEQPVLQHRRGNVVKHCQGHSGRELTVAERHFGRVAVDDGDVFVLHPLPQRRGEDGIELQASQALAMQPSNSMVRPGPGPASNTFLPRSSLSRTRSDIQFERTESAKRSPNWDYLKSDPQSFFS